MIFIDFEVFAYDWLCVCIDPAEGRKVIINDRDELRTYYEAHKTDVWVGFNIRHYDQYIFKGIMLDMDPKRLNDFIIGQVKVDMVSFTPRVEPLSFVLALLLTASGDEIGVGEGLGQVHHSRSNRSTSTTNTVAPPTVTSTGMVGMYP